ncbi:MAG: hypothetical protein WKF73_15335 [Nocardioidaceae bacterium]
MTGEVTASLPTSTIRCADQQGLDIWLEHSELRIGSYHRVPGLQRQLRLGGAGRTGIEGHGAPLHRVAEQERKADRDLQLVPLSRAQGELGERQVAVGDGSIPQLSAFGCEQQIAPAAGTHQHPALQVDHVLMGVRDGFGAHLAAFPGDWRRPGTGDAAQRGQWFACTPPAPAVVVMR